MYDQIKQIILEIRPDINPDLSDLLEEIDSFDIITFITLIEKAFFLKVPAEKVLPENFKNISSIVKLIDELKNEVSI